LSLSIQYSFAFTEPCIDRAGFAEAEQTTYAVRDDVRVAMQRALGVAVGALVAGQVPDDQGLVAGTR
jgi:hypothetical protein